MMNVLVLKKQIDQEPVPPQISAIAVDRLKSPDDAAVWLALRQRAFAGEDPPVRAWSVRDLEREVGGRPAQGVRRVTWLARPENVATDDPCGAVSLSRPIAKGLPASIHWLMVDPDWRRQGVGSLLLHTVERYCWDRAWRELRLETHRNWTAAVQFYRRHGYQ